MKKMGAPTRFLTTAAAAAALLVSAGCGGGASDQSSDAELSAPEKTVVSNGADVAAALDSAGVPDVMTGAWLTENEIRLSEGNAVTWLDVLNDGTDYRFCVLNVPSGAWAEYNSTDGGLVESSPDGGQKIGPECGE